MSSLSFEDLPVKKIPEREGRLAVPLAVSEDGNQVAAGQVPKRSILPARRFPGGMLARCLALKDLLQGLFWNRFFSRPLRRRRSRQAQVPGGCRSLPTTATTAHACRLRPWVEKNRRCLFQPRCDHVIPKVPSNEIFDDPFYKWNTLYIPKVYFATGGWPFFLSDSSASPCQKRWISRDTILALVQAIPLPGKAYQKPRSPERSISKKSHPSEEKKPEYDCRA